MATVKLMQRLLGKLQGVPTIDVSAGAADATKVPNTNAAGVLDPSIINATATSLGPASALRPLLLNASGVVDTTALPPGVSADVKIVTAVEALTAGNYVQTYYDGTASAMRVRKADNSNGRAADGFVLDTVALGVAVRVYFDGINNALTGLTAGTEYWLGVVGAPTATPPGSGVSQYLGKAQSVTELPFSWAEPVYL